MKPKHFRLLLLGLVVAGLLVASLVVFLAVWLSRPPAESPEAQQLRERLEAADGGWHNVTVRTRTEEGKKVTFAAGDHRLGGKRYSIMVLAREGVEGVTVEVEDAEESRLVAHWEPPGLPEKTLPDKTVSAHWEEMQRLMRQLLEAFRKDRQARMQSRGRYAIISVRPRPRAAALLGRSRCPTAGS